MSRKRRKKTILEKSVCLSGIAFSFRWRVRFKRPPNRPRLDFILSKWSLPEGQAVRLENYGGMIAKKKQILNILDTGKVELLGMTYFSPDNSSTADYRRWIDYALKKNPKTSFFIGLPWGLNGPESSLAAFSAISTVGQAVVYKGTVLKLRELYPETRFYWANYGRVAVELKRNFENGELAGVDAMVARSGKRAIFRDKMGHAASVTLDLSALVWLAVLYDLDLSSQRWVLSQNSKLKEICLKIANEEKKFNVDLPATKNRPKKQVP